MRLADPDRMSPPPADPPLPPGRDRTAGLLLLLALVVYAMTRLAAIEKFPIYFFCDEAMHTVQFQALLDHDWKALEEPEEFLPAYFLNSRMFNLSLSVYVQGAASLLAGTSVATVRTTSALASLSAAWALALLLRRVFRVREAWSVVAFLTIIPCWFLHSRTGFETVLMVSSYAWFLYFYLRGREGHPAWVLAAVAAGAATFYAYSPGQGVMLATGVLLLVSDGRHFLANRRWFAAAVVLGLLLFAPYVRFRLQHADAVREHLAELHSYWTQPLPLGTKLLTFGAQYFAGLSPRYWFTIEGVAAAGDGIRHLVPFRGHLPLPLAPFALGGIFLCLRGWRSAPHRVILIAFAAAPFSAALVEPGITRVLSFVIPFALSAALGFDWLLRAIPTGSIWLTARWFAAALLALAALGLWAEAITVTPLHWNKYGLNGQQWGAQAVFRELLPRYLKSDPGANLIVTHMTFNSPEVFPKFFGWMNDLRVTFASLDQICAGDTLPEPKDLVLLGAEEFASLPARPEVFRFEIREQVAWPDGRPGFFLGHLFLEPRFVAARRADPTIPVRPGAERLIVEGIPLSVTGGGIGRGQTGTLFREGGPEVMSVPGNALNIEISFDGPIALDAVEVEADAAAPARVSVWGSRAKETPFRSIGEPGDRSMRAALRGGLVDHVRIELSAVPGVSNQLRSIRLIPPKRE